MNLTLLDIPWRLAPAPVAVRADDRPARFEQANPPRPMSHERSRLVALECAYLPTGGILSGDSFAQLLRQGLDQPISTLARWIVDRDVVSFEVQGQIWLPMFQFEPPTLQVRHGVLTVVRELRSVFDDLELAEWFAHPNSFLGGQTPAVEVLRNEQAVLEVARLDRFVAAG